MDNVNKWGRWTPDDIQSLIEMHRAGLTAREIGKKLNRTRKAVSHRISLLAGDGVLQKRGYNEWKDVEIVELVRLKNDGLTHRKIAKEMGRSEGSISRKVRYLRDYQMLPGGRYMVWKEGEVEDLFDMLDKGFSVRECAEYLGRSRGGVVAKLNSPSLRRRVRMKGGGGVRRGLCVRFSLYDLVSMSPRRFCNKYDLEGGDEYNRVLECYRRGGVVWLGPGDVWPGAETTTIPVGGVGV